MLRVAGAVVLYNPKEEVFKNILSYINQVEFLYLVDNSDRKTTFLNKFEFNKSIKKIDNNGNIGIAAALNIAASRAIEEGFDLLLTMDQDGWISGNYIAEMLREFEKDNSIGILSSFIVHNKNPRKPVNFETEDVTTVMTSGSIINLSAYQKVGGFLEQLFIDYVDNEYCLRLKSFGFKVLKVNSVYVYHELGDVKQKKFFFRNVFPTNHLPPRLYYRTRNRFYIHKIYKDKFPEYIKFDRWVFVKEILKILLYEEDKIEKFKMIFYGYMDFKRNKFGKFELKVKF